MFGAFGAARAMSQYQKAKTAERVEASEEEIRELLKANGASDKLDQIAIMKALGSSIMIGDKMYAIKK